MTYTMNQPASWLAGYIPDLPTPFDSTGELDLAAFCRLCERQIAAGATALVVGELTGEDSTLSEAEHSELTRIAVWMSRGHAAVIAGAGSNSTSTAIELSRRAEADGADAVLSQSFRTTTGRRKRGSTHISARWQMPHACPLSCMISLPARFANCLMM